MQCTAILGSGARCGRKARPGARLCAFHQSVAFRRHTRAVEIAREPADEEALAEAAQAEGVDAEIAELRVLLRRTARAGDLEAYRRGMETLLRALQAQAALSGGSGDGLQALLDQVLDEIDAEDDAELEAEREAREAEAGAPGPWTPTLPSSF